MNNALQAMIEEATRLTRAGHLTAATAAIQQLLRGAPLSSSGPHGVRPLNPAGTTLAGAPCVLPADVLEGCVFEIRPQITPTQPLRPTEPKAPPQQPQQRGASSQSSINVGTEEFRQGSYSHASLTRQYKLFVPPHPAGQALALVVMLHGCTQDPDDFAAGTGMNMLAREQGICVLYPAQGQDANPSRCWNWFKHNHQSRGRGEPALIAAMTKAVMKEIGIDPRRVYIAGLSAGGAMAALVAAAYPELFAAVGVHSGLAPGAARNLPEALAAMKGLPSSTGLPTGAGHRFVASPKSAPAEAHTQAAVPVIVFHGDRDQTVHPNNGEQVIMAALRSDGTGADVEQGVSALGRKYTRSTHADEQGRSVAEHWMLHGAGHAWSGGQPAGSYTDANGPDASREMVRFFFEHPHRSAH